METNFVKADSGNLPKVDADMVALFFKNNPNFYGAELKNVKTTRSSRESYGDDAIGYVQLHREGDQCTIKCKICPEHKVKTSSYKVTLIVDENKMEIVSCECHDCAASAGGCKHAVAFLMWTHRRSEEPSCTSVECYWKKPIMSGVGSSIKFVQTKDLTTKKAQELPSNPTVLTEFLKLAKKNKIQNCELLKFQKDFKYADIRQFSMHHFMMQQEEDTKKDAEKLLVLMTKEINENTISKIEEETRKQSRTTIWYEMRYGRITASKAYEVSRCKTVGGSLVQTIMGARTADTKSMKRGRALEQSVLEAVAQKLEVNIRPSGLYISQEYPMIAASPDGKSKDALFEIKCPLNMRTMANYISNGIIAEKYKAQMQIQMYCSGFKKGYFCVADPDFEESKNVQILEVHYDSEHCTNLVDMIVSFWKQHIYPLLYRTVKLD